MDKEKIADEAQKALSLIEDTFKLNNISGLAALNGCVNYLIYCLGHNGVKKKEILCLMKTLDIVCKDLFDSGNIKHDLKALNELTNDN